MSDSTLADREIKAWVIGASAGGIEALLHLLPNFNNRIKFPVIVVTHLLSSSPNLLPQLLMEKCSLRVKEAESCEPIRPATIYLAPPDYHLSVEDNYTLSLSSEERVQFSRPSIDILFESAAEVYTDNLVGMLLTGANNDGARGMKRIKETGGFTIVQSPEDARFPEMPNAALRLIKPDIVQDMGHLCSLLSRIS